MHPLVLYSHVALHERIPLENPRVWQLAPLNAGPSHCSVSSTMWFPHCCKGGVSKGLGPWFWLASAWNCVRGGVVSSSVRRMVIVGRVISVPTLFLPLLFTGFQLL